MEKEKKFTTVCKARLAGFEGFYCSIWSPDDDVYNYSVEECAEEDKDFTFDYKGYYKAICEKYTEVWEEWMQEYIHEDIKLDFLQVWQPRFYNYENDACEVRISLTHQAKKAIIEKAINHRDKIAGWIKKNHTSSSGFISFLSNDIDDWEAGVLFNTDAYYQANYLAYMLYYIVKAELEAEGYTDERPEIYAYYKVCDQVSAYCFINDIDKGKAA
jgi:hypothetical protein|nr:MAG TPA: hypothetical protein [Caudoviricetes sp.]